MSEINNIQRSTHGPVSQQSLTQDFIRLGVKPGSTLLVHSSLGAIGWVIGGAQTVVQALQQVLGENGTLIMPTHSGGNSDPKHWQSPPVPESWWPQIRDAMPGYDGQLTVTRGMGAIVEFFRQQPRVKRSSHPQVSFAAWGAHANLVTDNHPLAFGFGEQSPLAKIYQLNGSVLSLGVSYDRNTSLHLAECRAQYASKTKLQNSAAVIVDGQRQWVDFDDIEQDSDDFLAIGEAYEQQGLPQAKGKVGYAQADLYPQRDLVDFAVQWMQRHRA